MPRARWGNLERQTESEREPKRQRDRKTELAKLLLTDRQTARKQQFGMHKLSRINAHMSTTELKLMLTHAHTSIKN